MASISNKRNTTIELMRFVSIFAIALVHFYLKLGVEGVYLGYRGNIGVEFFFLVSGFFLAKSALDIRENKSNLNIWDETSSYMSHKIGSLYFPMFISIIVCYLFQLITVYLPSISYKDIAYKTISDIFELTLLRQAGFTASYVNGTFWFVSALLLVSLLCYPLILKHGESYYIFAALSALFILGYMNKLYGSSLGDTEKWSVYFYKCQLRAFAEMNLGIVMYGLSKKLSQIHLTKIGKFIISIVELVIYVCFALYIYYPSNKRLDYPVLAFLFIAMLITLSQTTYLRQALDKIKFFPLALGKLSMYVYFEHQIFAKYVFPIIATKYNLTAKELLIPYCIVVIIAAVLLLMLDKFWKKHRPLKKLFIKKEDALTE